MSNVQVFPNKAELAEAIAKRSISILRDAIDKYSEATWVLAGGSTPILAYKIIAAENTDTLDWSKVTVIMGDERIGPLDGPDSNWNTINNIIGDLPTVKLQPVSDLKAEKAADDYNQRVSSLPKADSGLPRFDLVWLGVGEDGHTLSVFPRHESLLPSTNLVITVHNSPKPPSDRISLSLRALQGTQHALILASGIDKKEAVAAAQRTINLPIALAASIIETHDGHVEWLIDQDAA